MRRDGKTNEAALILKLAADITSAKKALAQLEVEAKKAFDYMSKYSNDSSKALWRKRVEAVRQAENEIKSIQEKRIDAISQYESIKNKGVVSQYVSRWKWAFDTVTRYASAAALIGIGVQGVRSLIAEFLNVEKAIFRISGITSQSISSTAKLTDTIYGLATSYGVATADITNFAIEMAKLGKTSEEIDKLGNATATLSVILGEDMSTSGKLLVTTMNQFNLVTSESSRVAGVFSDIIKKSPLAVRDLQIAMQYIGVAANAAGIQIEELGEYMKLLSNAGLKASKIGTGLRNVMLKLASDGKTFKEVMDEMYKSGISLSEALELFGKRGATAGYLMVQNWGELRDSINEVPTAIEQMTTTLITASAKSNQFLKIWAKIKSVSAFFIGGDNTLFPSPSDNEINNTKEYTDAFGKISNILGDFKLDDDLSLTLDTLYDAADGVDVVVKRFEDAMKGKGYANYRISGTVNELREALTVLKDVNNEQKKAREEAFKQSEIAEKQLKTIAKMVKVGELTVDDARVKADEAVAKYKSAIFGLFEEDEIEKKAKSYSLRLLNAISTAYSPALDDEYSKVVEDIKKFREVADRINKEALTEGTTDPEVTTSFIEGADEERKRIIKLLQMLCRTGLVAACTMLCSEYGIGCSKGGDKSDPLMLKVIYAKLKRELAGAHRAEAEALIAMQDTDGTAEGAKDMPTPQEYFEGRGLVNKKEYIQFLSDRSKSIIDRIKIDGINEKLALAIAHKERMGAIDNARADIQNLYETETDPAKKATLFAALIKFDADDEKEIENYVEDVKDSIDKSIKAISDVDTSEEKGVASMLKLSKAQTKQILSTMSNALGDVADIYKAWSDEMFNQVNERLEAEKESIKNRYDFEKDTLRLAAENNLITQAQYSKRSSKLEKDRVRELNKIAKEQFDKKKKQDIKNAIVDGIVQSSQAFIKGWMSGFTPADSAILAAISAAIVSAKSALTIAAISKREYTPVTFADGGLVKGKSHAQGGIPFSVNGAGGYEMEGNEYIIKKDSVTPKTLPILDAINNDTRYNSRYFATGGQVDATQKDVSNQIVRAYITNKDLDAYDRNKVVRNKNKKLF